jgi:transposase
VNDTVTISKKEYEELLKSREKLARLELEMQQLRKLIYGSKSERFISEKDTNQLSFFDEAATEPPVEPEVEEVTYKRKKKKKDKPKRTIELPSHLRRKVEVIEPELDASQGDVKKIGTEVTEILEYTPGDLYVRRIERPKYVIKEQQEDQESDDKVVVADMPTQVIPKGNAGASLLAYILTAKFIDHLPFYRQRMIFKRSGVDIAPSTIGGWMNQSCKLLEGLYYILVEQVKNSPYIQADESPIKVLDKVKKGTTHQGYMWTFHAPLLNLVAYYYAPSRSQKVPLEFLGESEGVVQTDGYGAYGVLERAGRMKIILHACMAHARRKFVEAEQNDGKRAEAALLYFQKLYDIERVAREEGMDYNQRGDLRKREAVPVLDAFKEWLDENKHQVLPKSKIGGAIAYTLNLWSRLVRYTDAGHFEIDNNLVENAIRPLAVGRKNYLFAGSHEAAQRIAMMYSLFASCKVNQIDSYRWLEEVLRVIPDHKVTKLEELLPSNERFAKFKLQ